MSKTLLKIAVIFSYENPIDCLEINVVMQLGSIVWMFYKLQMFHVCSVSS